MPTASSTESGPRPPVMSRIASPRSSSCSCRSTTSTPRARDAGQPLGHEVDADDAVALVLGDPAGEVTDRAETQDDERAALGHAGVLHALPGRGQDVGEVGEPVVRRPLGQLDVGELRLRHPQVLGLPPGTSP